MMVYSSLSKGRMPDRIVHAIWGGAGRQTAVGNTRQLGTQATCWHDLGSNPARSPRGGGGPGIGEVSSSAQAPATVGVAGAGGVDTGDPRGRCPGLAPPVGRPRGSLARGGGRAEGGTNRPGRSGLQPARAAA